MKLIKKELTKLWKEKNKEKISLNSDPLNIKGVGGKNEEKSLIKMMQGPFYKQISKD